jgi:hypothetical protein
MLPLAAVTSASTQVQGPISCSAGFGRLCQRLLAQAEERHAQNPPSPHLHASVGLGASTGLAALLPVKRVERMRRTLFLVGAAFLVAAGGMASAQSNKREAPAAAAVPETQLSPAEIRERGAQYLADCVNDWDKGTHMSKKDWTRTCRRVVQRRIDFMLQQPK